jgi:hypothetical protein
MAVHGVTLRHYIKDGTPDDIIHITKEGETCNQANWLFYSFSSD